jgi:hypothetical protein
MNLYIWDDVLRDYTPGLVVVLAPDAAAALRAVRRSVYGDLREFHAQEPQVVRLPGCRPMRPRIWVRSGGS